MKTLLALALDEGLRRLAKLAQLVPPGQPYLRLPLYAGAGGELALCHWAPGLPSAPHDHGGAEGLVLVLSGTLAQSRFEQRRGGLVEVEQQVVRRGDLDRIARDDIHQVTALDEAWTLHVYWDEGETFRIFDADERRTLVVRDTGAWLPAAADNVVAVTYWS